MLERRGGLLIDGVELPYVLTAPAEARAALLLIPGSMNSDVDGNFAPMFPGQPAFRPHMYKDLAQHLAARGVAVLRFAKSGPGTGAVVRDTELSRDKYRVFPQRVRVAAAFLEELARRLPALPLALAGHSEGAVVATLLAAEGGSASSPPRALVLLSGPSQPLLRLMIWQHHERERAQSALSDEQERSYAEALRVAHDYAAGRPIAERATQNPFAPMLRFFLQPENAPYLRSLERADPAAALAAVRLPVLIVQGGRDASVLPENADLLRAAAPSATVARFPELQHFYKRATAGLTPEASFALEDESDSAVADTVAAWLTRHLVNATASVE